MRKLLLAVASVVVACSPTPAPAQVSSPSPRPALQGWVNLPLTFEPNLGQGDPSFAFLSRGAGFTVGLSAAGGQLSLGRQGFGWSFVGANPAAALIEADPLPSVTHYYLGRNPAGWVRGVPNAARVVEAALYPGIDLDYHGRQKRLEYDFTVHPGASPESIRLSFSGAIAQLDEAGNLELVGPAGRLVEPGRWRSRTMGAPSARCRWRTRWRTAWSASRSGPTTRRRTW